MLPHAHHHNEEIDTTQMTKVLVVLSGGQDSTTCLFWACHEYGAANVHTITFDYGQKHDREISAAHDVGYVAGVRLNMYHVKLGAILQSTSPLVDRTQVLEQYKNHEQMEQIIGDRVEKTFVPMRNALFLTVAANRAVAIGASRLVTGVCQADNANYPDCTLGFILQQEVTINSALGNRNPHLIHDPKHPSPLVSGGEYISIATPLMDMSKRQSIDFAIGLPGAYGALSFTHTAYDGSFPPTGSDHATVLRAYGFEQAEVPDPLIMRAVVEMGFPRPKTRNYSADRWEWALQKVKEDMTTRILPKSMRWWDFA